MDVHVPYAITIALRLRGVDVLTAQEDNSQELEDAALLDRATALGRILFTRDDDLLREGALRQKRGESFVGIIYAHQLNISVGQCVIDLELVAEASDSDEWIGRIEYLPLK
jgi:predicted nuclease of predicted toxin-antitoxin system